MLLCSKDSNIKTQMFEMIFLSLFFYVSNFYTVNIPVPDSYGARTLIRKNKNEYIMISNRYFSSYAYKLEMKYDNITFLDKRDFGDNSDYTVKSILILDNNIIFYIFMFHVFIENNGKTNEIVWENINWFIIKRYLTDAFNNHCILICTYTKNYSLDNRYDFQLNLIKAPYTEISKEIEIETLSKNTNVKLIGLKDYFVYIKINENKNNKINITYKFLDLDLNFVDSFNKTYENYSSLYFYSIPNDGEVNTFMICFLKKEDMLNDFDIYKCQIINYENKDLHIIQTIDIPIRNYQSYYDIKIIFFDKNKIAFCSCDYLFCAKEYINILQYENQVLSFYKNFKNLTISHLPIQDSNTKFIITELGVAAVVGESLCLY